MFIFMILSFLQMDNIINCFTTYNCGLWICEISKIYICWLISALIMAIFILYISFEITIDLLK